MPNLLALFLFLACAYSFTLSVTEITPATVALTWENVTQEAYQIYVNTELRTTLSPNSISSQELAITPNIVNTIEVCYHTSRTTKICSNAFPIETSLIIEDNTPSIVEIAPTKLALFWHPFYTSTPQSDTLNVQRFDNGRWKNIATVLKDHDENPLTQYGAIVNCEIGELYYYRIVQSSTDSRTNSVSYATTANVYDAPLNPVKVDILTSPSSIFTGSVGVISNSSSLYLKYDMTRYASSCDPIYARLVIPQGLPSKNYGGFLRIYSNLPSIPTSTNHPEPIDYNFYLSDPLLQIETNFQSNVVSLKADLNRKLPDGYDIVSQIKSWKADPSTNTGFLLTFEETDSKLESSLSTIASLISLEIASFKNYYQALASVDLEVSLPTPLAIGPCGPASVCSTRAEWNSFTFVDPLPSGAQLVQVLITLDGNFPEDYITVSLQDGVIGDQLLLESFSCSVEQQLFFSSKFYPIEAGAWPGYNYRATNTINIQSNSNSLTCISKITVSFQYLASSSPNGACDPNVPSASPSASPSPSRTPSSSFSSSISSTPSPSSSAATKTPTPTRSPLISSNIQPPVPSNLPQTPSATATPSQTRFINTQPISTTPTPAPTRCATCGTPVPQVTEVPNPNDGTPVIILDELGNPIITVDINAPGNTLLVGPAPEFVPQEQVVQTPIVTLILLDALGNEVQPENEVEICFAVPTSFNKDENCLGFINEEFFPPKWECQDRCLNDGSSNLICGKTDHFTSFALLLTGDNGDQCTSKFDLIFDEKWKDGVLIGSFSAAFLLCLFAVCLFLAFTPIGGRILRGEEGTRIHKLRSQANSTVSSEQEEIV